MVEDEILFAAKQNRKLVFLHVLGCLTFVGMSIFIMSYYNDIIYKIIGWFGIVFFGICCFPLFLKCLICPRTNLILQRKRFYYCNNGSKNFYIEYKNVSEIGLIEIKGTKLICFNLKDKSEILKKMNIIEKFLMHKNKDIYGYEFSISLLCTGENTAKTYEIMKSLIDES